MSSFRRIGITFLKVAQPLRNLSLLTTPKIPDTSFINLEDQPWTHQVFVNCQSSILTTN